MTLGITTFHCCPNYGAVLQATALVQYLRQTGIEARILDRRPAHLRALEPWTSPRRVAKNLLMLRHYRALRTRLDRTLAFVMAHQTLTERFDGIEDTVARWPRMDAYITGSDQVWNVERHVNPTFFLLPADPAQSRLISYAASFGTAQIPEERKTQVAEALRRFHAISVREQSGADIVHSLTGKTPVVVCDPVFLHAAEHYAGLEKPYPTPESYILVHSIGVDADLDFAVRAAKERLGLPVLQFLGGAARHPTSVTDRAILDAGPAEYLHLMRNARVVCTNSFHGTAFSLILRRPFISTPALAGLNTRIEHVLNLFQEGARSVTTETTLTPSVWDVLLSADAERWSRIHEQQRHVAMEFLSAALGRSMQRPGSEP